MLGEKLMKLRKRQGYSQQEVADMLSVSRQTISNWESDQGAPALDKAIELARIYKISLDDLVEHKVEIIAKEKTENDHHILQRLVGKTVIIDCSDQDFLLDTASGGKVTIIEATAEWLRIEYDRTKENTLFKKEKVVRLIDPAVINGFQILEDES